MGVVSIVERKEDAMKRLAIAGLVVVVLGVVAGSALASDGKSLLSNSNTSVIYDSTPPDALPGNIPSVGPEAYAFRTLGNKIQFAPGTHKLTSVVVALSSWACQRGHWYSRNCDTSTGATFSQPVTLSIWNANHTTMLASSTQAFQIPYRPSVSTECAGTDRPGGWYQQATKACFNGLANEVTFNFTGHVTLPGTVVYEISYDTTHYGPNPVGEGAACFQTGNCPYDSLNIALSTGPSIGSDLDTNALWTNGAAGPPYDLSYKTPAVQFNAARLWKV
jgi:hypothetical protein